MCSKCAIFKHFSDFVLATALRMLYTALGSIGAGLSASRRAWERVPLHELLKTLKINHSNMKKTIFTLAVLAGVAMADTVTTPEELTWNPLTITTPTNGALSSGNSSIDWNEATGKLEDSWQLSFTLDPSRLSNQYIFGTVKSGSGADGYTLSITSNGTISLNQNKSNSVLTVGSYTADDSEVAITLQFVKYVNSNGEFNKGVFTLTVGDASGTYVVENADNTVFNKGANNNVWTNGGAEKLSGISLMYADSVVVEQIVPEPTTATLSLLALAGLAARRRRK